MLWFAKCWFSFDSLDKVIIDHLKNVFIIVCLVNRGKGRVRSQDWHEHNLKWYNIRVPKRCEVFCEGKYMFSIPWYGAVLGWGGSSWLPLTRRIPLPTSPRSQLTYRYWIPWSRQPSFCVRFYHPLISVFIVVVVVFVVAVIINVVAVIFFGFGETSSLTAATLPPAKGWKYEGLLLNCRSWQRSERQVTVVGDKEIENVYGKVNRRQW